jgi:alkylated DNA nucleotide flippase Atl1
MDEDYAELVLGIVEQIPPGQVATYGDIAEIVGRGGPRQVGHVMALLGGGVPWWRVVRADGRPARSLEEPGLTLLRADKTPIKGDRVDLARARFTIGEADNRESRSTTRCDHELSLETRHWGGFTLRGDL